MLPLANDAARPRGFVVVCGDPADRRIALFRDALARLDYPEPRIVRYADLLAGRATLPEIVRPGHVVRVESPGKSLEVERAILLAGADANDDPEARRYDRLSRHAIERLPVERGRILPSRQWYLGFCRALRLIERQLAACRDYRLMSVPADIALMFDKRRCHETLRRAGIPVPRSIGPVHSHAELIECMRRERCWRVFVKLAHGSSASGVVAYETNGPRQQATTTVEMVRHNGELRLYNSRRMRVYRDPREIAALIDALCRHRVHAEQWLPKASIGGRIFDLRIVVIAGRMRHVVARMSRGPITNLHLLNERSDAAAVRAHLGDRAWGEVRDACERALALFPDSLYAGVDLMLTPGLRRHAVLEVNAFGDLLLGALDRGMDTYEAEIRAMAS